MEDTQYTIEELRLSLKKEVIKADYNFLDPKIIELSQKLDKLIVEHMVKMNDLK